jgi:hypothetical protein
VRRGQDFFTAMARRWQEWREGSLRQNEQDLQNFTPALSGHCAYPSYKKSVSPVTHFLYVGLVAGHGASPQGVGKVILEGVPT